MDELGIFPPNIFSHFPLEFFPFCFLLYFEREEISLTLKILLFLRIEHHYVIILIIENRAGEFALHTRANVSFKLNWKKIFLIDDR